MSRPIITFTSDFGLNDWFVGVVHGLLNGICREAHVVDLTHQIPPGHIARAAFLLEAASPDFPPGTVHLAVVDPGVGTARRAIAAAARGQLFVGPDNGILDWALRDPAARVHELTEERWFRQPVSRTFHARDIFAPVAAHLASGEKLERFGHAVPDAVRLPHPVPQAADGTIEGRVMFVDHFGNALTNIDTTDLERVFPEVSEGTLEVRVLSHRILGLSRSYGEHALGRVVAIVGSSGRLEIAQVGGNCADRLGIGEGDAVRVQSARRGGDGSDTEPAGH